MSFKPSILLVINQFKPFYINSPNFSNTIEVLVRKKFKPKSTFFFKLKIILYVFSSISDQINIILVFYLRLFVSNRVNSYLIELIETEVWNSSKKKKLSFYFCDSSESTEANLFELTENSKEITPLQMPQTLFKSTHPFKRYTGRPLNAPQTKNTVLNRIPLERISQ